jgi:HEAT repeat protein
VGLPHNLTFTALLPGAMTCLALTVTGAMAAPAVLSSAVQDQAEGVVEQLRQLPTRLPATVRSDGTIDPVEQRRRELYGELRRLGPDAVAALARGLEDRDVHLRRNVALALNALAGNWFDRSKGTMDIRVALPALMTALEDADGSVRAWSAQAIGEIGAPAARAVPALVVLLRNADEGSRNSACIPLYGIGRAATDALPALEKALSDPSADVRRFAQRAVGKIRPR